MDPARAVEIPDTLLGVKLVKVFTDQLKNVDHVILYSGDSLSMPVQMPAALDKIAPLA
jgi:hypothetical protein